MKNKPVAKPLYCDNEEECKIQKKNKPKKNNTNLPPIEDEIEILAEEVAPVFLRKKKQEETRAVKKARQDFLQSGIPELLKQQTAIRSALEQRDVEIFPRISHVTQLETKVTGSSSNFNFLASLIKPLICRQLPKRAMFDAKINKSFETTVQPLQNHPSNGQNLEWHQCKEWIHHLKHARKINFPFFRTLRAMLSKERNTDEYLWSDVCATTQWIDSLANHGSVQQLQQWLKRWKLRAGEDVDPSPKRRKTRKNVKRKRADFESSEDDMDVTDTVESSDSGSNSDQVYFSTEHLQNNYLKILLYAVVSCNADCRATWLRQNGLGLRVSRGIGIQCSGSKCFFQAQWKIGLIPTTRSHPVSHAE